MNLTQSQNRAILCSGRNLQIIACAGSGKTEVVARRVAHLLMGRGSRSLEPRNIIAFTFTDKAAMEMKERIVLRTREEADSDISGMAEMYVGTIHGFCHELLQTETSKYEKYEALDAARQTLYVNRKSRLTGLTTSTNRKGRVLRRYTETYKYLNALAVLREDNAICHELSGCSVAEGLKLYKRQINEDSYLDFSAMLENAVSELTNNPALRKRIGERIRYVVVDEYQDVNPIQERLIRILHDLGAGVCVVGDDDQTIYQWRGSSAEDFIKFKGRYPEVKRINLESNFRSSIGVIGPARWFIGRVKPRLSKSMRDTNVQPYEVGDVVALSYDSPEEEASYIVDTIKSLCGIAFKEGGKERGLTWSDMAVLLRSVKHNGSVIATALKEANIPYVVSGSTGLFETDEATAARKLFHFIAKESIQDESPPTEDGLRQAWENPSLGLSKSKVKAAVNYAKGVRDCLNGQGNGVSQRIYLQEVFLEFLKRAALREENVPSGNGEIVLFNLGRFSRIIGDWESINFTPDIESFSGFAKFLHYQAEAFYGEGEEESDAMKPDAVQVMTVHQAKGREWPVVFMPALLKNRFPATIRANDVWQLIPRKAIKNAERYDGSDVDERRLFYVAMTRSKKFLHMTWAPIQGKNNRYLKPSQFWEDVMTAEKWVSRFKPDYSGRKRLKSQSQRDTGAVVLTVSDLQHLLQCGYQYKLNVQYGFNAPINNRRQQLAEYGDSLHRTLAEVHRRAIRGEPVKEEDVPGLVERFLPRYHGGELGKSYDANAPQRVKDYIRKNRNALRLVTHAEQDVEFHLDDNISVKGRIDLVREDTGKTTIVDLKSSLQSQPEEVSKIQMFAYALGYRELTGRDADFVELYQIKGGRRKRTLVTSGVLHNMRQEIKEAAAAVHDRRLEPEPSEKKCKQCDFSSLCGARAALGYMCRGES